MAIQQKITPFLWYAKEAEEAAGFYTSIFPDSRVTRVTAMQSDSPSGPPGSVKVVEFVLFGQTFIAMSAGPLDPFNHAVSFVVNCDTQAELDRYWNALLEGGGSPEQCGWLKDRFGLSDEDGQARHRGAEGGLRGRGQPLSRIITHRRTYPCQSYVSTALECPPTALAPA